MKGELGKLDGNSEFFSKKKKRITEGI